MAVDLDKVAQGLAHQVWEDDTVTDVLMDYVHDQYAIDPADDEYPEFEIRAARELMLRVIEQLVLTMHEGPR